MSLDLRTEPVLLLIDVQATWTDPIWGPRNNPLAEDNIASLLGWWRRHDLPRILVQHHSANPASLLAPGQPGCALRGEVAPNPGERLLTKSVNSAFIGTGLQDILTQNDWTDVVVVGLTTVHCCSTTIRMGANLGFNMVAVADAMATFDAKNLNGETIPAEVMHQVELAALTDEFATIMDTKDIID